MVDDQQSPSDLFEQPVDAKEAAEITKRNMAPAGEYVTDPEEFGQLSVTAQVNEDGRRVFAFFGRMTHVKEQVQAQVRFRLSPDARPKKDFQTGEIIEGKDDLNTRLYAAAVKAYTLGHDGATPKKLGDLTEWLQTVGGLRVGTMQGDEDLIVLRLNAPRA